MTTTETPRIRLENISKNFGPVQANKNINLDITAGKITALLGENGAGKSTLMSILAGRYQPSGGTIYVDGAKQTFGSTKDAIEAGIGMVYQHFMLVEAMTVAENVFLGQEPGVWLKPAQMAEKVRDLADSYGLPGDPDRLVRDLSMGGKQRGEILKLLRRESDVLIFDEPTAVLTPQESEQLYEAIRKMAAQDKAIVFISHKLGEVMSLSDEVAILRKGEVVDALPTAQVSSKGELARRMVGKDILLEVDREAMPIHQNVLRLENLCTDVLKGVSLSLRQGEVLGIVGVAGNGQNHLVEAICGLLPPSSGEMNILGKPWQEFFREKTWDANLSYIPEDRLGLATCRNLDLTDNFLLTTRDGFTSAMLLDRDKARATADKLIKQFNVYPPNVSLLAGQLSGGNLQKMVLAREFYRRPKLIVAEQPTQGLDISAIEEVWDTLLKAREEAGILLVTGDLSEALALSDRIAVMFDGRIMDVFPVSDAEKVRNIGLLMAGVEGDGVH